MVDYSCIVVVGLVIVEFLLTVGDCCCCGVDGLEITLILLFFSSNSFRTLDLTPCIDRDVLCGVDTPWATCSMG